MAETSYQIHKFFSFCDRDNKYDRVNFSGKKVIGVFFLKYAKMTLSPISSS